MIGKEQLKLLFENLFCAIEEIATEILNKQDFDLASTFPMNSGIAKHSEIEATP